MVLHAVLQCFLQTLSNLKPTRFKNVKQQIKSRVYKQKFRKLGKLIQLRNRRKKPINILTKVDLRKE